MKLIYCPECNDIKKLRRLKKTGHKPTRCTCGKSFGWYKEDGHNAAIGGSAVPLGISNPSFTRAILAASHGELGTIAKGTYDKMFFDAWVMVGNPRIEVVKE